MNNYSHSKLISAFLVLCVGLLSNSVLAADPANDSDVSVENKEPKTVLLEHYLAAAQNHLGSFSKYVTGKKNDENKTNTNILNTEPSNLGANVNFISPIRNIFYNPEHPAELFDKLIFAYNLCLSVENQCILWGQDFLGKDSQIIINAKKNHKTNAVYLNALKEQKLMIEKQQNSPKLQSLLKQIK